MWGPVRLHKLLVLRCPHAPRQPQAKPDGCLYSTIILFPFTMNQIQELSPGLVFGLKNAQHRAGHRQGILLLHPPHHHAEMVGLHHNSHPERIDLLLNRLRDLTGQVFLDLEPSTEDID